MVRQILFFMNMAGLILAQLSPGDLHKKHAELEGLQNCTTCHVVGKKLSSQNCLACHTLLKERIQEKKGLHALPEFYQCEKCHVDHLGREYEMVFWPEGIEAFDHSKTGYTLQGKHQDAACNDCHKAENISDPQKLLQKCKDLDRTFLGLEENCLSCHKNEHRDQLSSTCLNCHDLNGWKPALNFDHSQSNYKLSGRHLTVACEKCHTPIKENTRNETAYVQYKGLKFASCNDCHNDVHNNRFGATCTNCHSTKSWVQNARLRFDHSQTNYPLEGKHKNVVCEKCHLPGKPLKIAAFEHCSNCHIDRHQSQFGRHQSQGECESCHNVSGFKPSTFSISDHSESSYPLTGSHLAVPCMECHKTSKPAHKSAHPTLFRFSSLACNTCHQDPHNGKTLAITIAGQGNEKSCNSCHETTSWAHIKFEHDKTPFALKGAHNEAACEKCHKVRNTNKWLFKGVDQECTSCHIDQHKGQFVENGKTDCARCHTETDWFAEKFDHESHSRFSLKGAHQFVACNACHKPEQNKLNGHIVYRPLEINCESCHGKSLNPKKRTG